MVEIPLRNNKYCRKRLFFLLTTDTCQCNYFQCSFLSQWLNTFKSIIVIVYNSFHDMIQEVGQQTQDQKNIMLSHFLGHYAWLEIHQERTNQQGDQGQLPMGPIVHLLNSAEAGWVTLHHTLTLKRENSDINLFFYLLQLLMNLHANLNFLHPDQINQSIDKWKFIKWTLALGKMKEDRIAAILFQSFFFIALLWWILEKILLMISVFFHCGKQWWWLFTF